MSTPTYNEQDSKAQIQAWKEALDIVTVAEMYGELVKVGANYKYKDDPSLGISPAKQIFNNYSDPAKEAVGSVLDLIMYMEKCDLAAGIQKLKALNGVEEYHVDPAVQLKRKQKASTPKFSLHQIGLFGQNNLTAVSPYIPYLVDCGDGSCYLQIKEPFIKLFETDKLDGTLDKKIAYVFTKLLGYDTFYQCPSIILRDSTGKIVDMVAYRPTRPASFNNWDDKTKYILKNSNFRGANFLYPFQQEMEKLMQINDVVMIGEGIKNGLNAYIRGLPFISLEGTDNETSEALIQYIHALLEKGFKIVGGFDGDKSGQKGFNNFKQLARLPKLENFLDFESGIDFTDFIVEGNHE